MTKEKRRKLREPQAVNNSGKIIMVKSGAPFRHRWRFAYPPNTTNYAPMQGGYTLLPNTERKEEKPMSDLTHLFKVGKEVVCLFDGEQYVGTVTETHTEHIIVNVPDISDHCYFDRDMLDLVYPAYNFTMLQ